MDGLQASISPSQLYARLGTASAPLLIDVRRPDAFRTGGALIAAAVHHPPADVDRWLQVLPAGRHVVVYCVHGHEVSQGAAAALRTAGVAAAYLEGGFAGWTERGLPTRKNLGAGADRWVTRERPKIDRIACPWLVARFINPDAEFIYVPVDQVLTVAKESGATPYDIKGVELGHVGERCSFDAIMRAYDIQDAALDRLATIVRGSDTSRPDLAPQCPGLSAISYGLSANFSDDHEQLRHGMVMYDALYTWCRSAPTGHPA
jgi:rhodanese-related sulfurtransferase